MFEAFVILMSILPVVVVVFLPIMNAARMRTFPDIFEPPWVVAGCLIIGTTIRSLFLIYDPEVERKMFQVLGPLRPEEALPIGLLAVNLGTLAWWAGYHTRQRVRLFSKPRRVAEISQTRFFWVNMGILSVSILLVLAYLNTINFFSSLSSFGLSAKRMFVVGDVAGNTTTFMYFRMASDFIAVVTILYLAELQSRASNSARRRLALLGLFVLACLTPFVASARGEIIYLFFSLLAVHHYLRKRIGLNRVMIYLAAAFMILGFMGEMRKQAYQRINHGYTDETFALTDVMHTLAYNAHFLGVGKTAVVVAQIPEKHDFLLGSSYVSLFIAPIPRTLWPEKPVVRIGRFVGVELYERGSFSGVPPGLYGEAFLNFGWIGLMVMPFLFGYWCRAIYVRLVLERQPQDFFAIALYGILWVFMMDVLVTDFTGNIMRIVRYIGPFYLIYWVASSNQRVMRPLVQEPAE